MGWVRLVSRDIQCNVSTDGKTLGIGWIWNDAAGSELLCTHQYSSEDTMKYIHIENVSIIQFREYLNVFQTVAKEETYLICA